MEIDTLHGDEGKKGKHGKSEKAKESTGKHQSICFVVKSGNTSRKVDTRTLLLKWKKRVLLELRKSELGRSPR